MANAPKMNRIHLLFLFRLFGFTLTSPQHRHELVRAYALNPAEINNIYFNPTVVNHQRDVAPQPLIRPEATIEETVREVEELIRKDPELPRLTRGEIIDILENITKNDESGSGKSSREEGKRALMVVMPFTAGSAQGDDIKELYTRTPITRIIGVQEYKEKEKTKSKMKKPPRKWELNMENEILTNSKGNDEVPQFQFLPEIKTTTTERAAKKTANTKKRRPYGSSYVEQTTTTKLKSSVSPSSPPPDTHRQKEENAATKLPAPKIIFKPEKKHANHNYEKSVSSGMHVVAPPVFMTVNDDSYSHPYLINMKRPLMQPEVTIEEVKITPDMYGDTPKPKPKAEVKVTTPKSLPNKAVENGIVSKSTTTLQITTATEKNVINQIEEEEGKEQVPHIVKQVTSTTEKVKNQQPFTEASSILDNMSIPDKYKGAIKGLDLLITPDHNKTPFVQQILKPIHPDIPKLPASTNVMPDISNVANNLSPEMKDLLMSFGLINRPNSKKPDTTTTEVPYIQNAQINPESYVRFKPLPINSPGRNDMEELLSSFGLGRNSFRNQKSMAYDKQKKTLTKASEYDLAAVPDNLKSVMYDLGFNENNLQYLKTEKNHVFKPDLQQNATEEELKKLGKLLDMIKDLERMKGNITEESLKDFDAETLKELIGNFNGNVIVPLDEKDTLLNPEKFEYNLTKKGFKREDETTTEHLEVVTVTPTSISSETSSTTNVSVTTSDITPTTSEAFTILPDNSFDASSDESKSNGLEDLEASFGGMVAAPPTTTEEELTTTTTPRTGFYYLLDWNTFLELDNQSGKRVNLRFQPHAGNPRYFTSVTVP